MKQAGKVIKILRLLFVAVILFLAVFFLINRDSITIDAIVNRAPENLIAAAAVYIVLYGLKSFSIFFPIIALQISAGLIFPMPVAILVGFMGAFTEVNLPYLISRKLGASGVENILQKYPKVDDLVEDYGKNPLFIAYFLRVLGFLPIDVVSALLGSMKIPYGRYIAGSLLGMTPGIFATTILGSSITRPGSPAFIASVSVTALLAAGSFAIYFFYDRKKKRQRQTEK